MEMDDKNRDILRVLVSDARISTSELARQLGLSETGVRYRIDKLQEAGIIRKYTIGVDPGKLGVEVQVVLGMKSNPERLEECLRMLRGQDEIGYVTRTTGEYDVVAMAGFTSIAHLSSFLKAVYAMTGITNCSVMHVLEEIKAFSPTIA